MNTLQSDKSEHGLPSINHKDQNMNIGDYIVIQRQKYSKIHKISNKLSVMVGNNRLELQNIIGRPFSTTFKMVPKKNERQVFVLEECTRAESLAEKLIKDITSGTDNRNIVGDDTSQKLSKEEIDGFRDSGMTGCEIVSHLLENSKTFQEKTEYSQEKYLKKKEKKYFDFITIRKPTLRLICDIIYNQDPMKVMGLRCDTLSQLVTGVGIGSGGTYIVYEGSCEGLPTAALLNYLGDTGYIVHTFPGLSPQRQAILAMNFSELQKERLISVSIQSLIQKLSDLDLLSPKTKSKSKCNLRGDNTSGTNGETFSEIVNSDGKAGKRPDEINRQLCENLPECDSEENISSSIDDHKVVCKNTKDVVAEEYVVENYEILNAEELQDRKRKMTNSEETEVKKPRWEIEVDRAADLLLSTKADGLVIVAREDPADVLFTLLPYLGPSRNFAIYCWCREPLMELYLKLKKRGGVINVHLTESFFRTYQVLPNRTHPDIQMSGSGGYILTGTVVIPETL